MSFGGIDNIKISNLDNLYPLTNIKTEEDILEHKNKGINVLFTYYDFVKKYPNVDVSKIYLEKGTIPFAYYWDKEKFILIEFLANNILFDSDIDLEEIINESERLYNEKSFKTLLNRVPSKFVLELLEDFISLMPKEEQYSIFLSEYLSSSFGFNNLNKNFVTKMFESKTEKDIIKTEEAIKDFNEELIVYRGEGSKSTPYNKTYSWTLNRKIATLFLSSSDEKARLITGKIKKKDILEYIKREEEILIYPEKVEIVDIIEMPGINDVRYETFSIMKEFYNYKKMLLEVNFFKDLKGHDKIHTLRVMFLALLIIELGDKKLSKENKDILLKACIYHDIARDNDLEDNKHGEYGYKYLLDNKIIKKENSILEFLMKYHCIDDKEAIEYLSSTDYSKRKINNMMLMYKILKDADGLDRLRFGVRELDMDYLRLDISKTLVLIAVQSIKYLKL